MELKQILQFMETPEYREDIENANALYVVLVTGHKEDGLTVGVAGTGFTMHDGTADWEPVVAHMAAQVAVNHAKQVLGYNPLTGE